MKELTQGVDKIVEYMETNKKQFVIYAYMYKKRTFYIGYTSDMSKRDSEHYNNKQRYMHFILKSYLKRFIHVIPLQYKSNEASAKLIEKKEINRKHTPWLANKTGVKSEYHSNLIIGALTK